MISAVWALKYQKAFKRDFVKPDKSDYLNSFLLKDFLIFDFRNKNKFNRKIQGFDTIS